MLSRPVYVLLKRKNYKRGFAALALLIVCVGLFISLAVLAPAYISAQSETERLYAEWKEVSSDDKDEYLSAYREWQDASQKSSDMSSAFKTLCVAGMLTFASAGICAGNYKKSEKQP